MSDNLLPRRGDVLVLDVHSHDEWTSGLNPLGAGGALEAEGSFTVVVEHFVYTDGSPDKVRLHVPRLGSGVCYDMGDELVWDERIRDVIRAAAVALGIIDRSQS